MSLEAWSKRSVASAERHTKRQTLRLSPLSASRMHGSSPDQGMRGHACSILFSCLSMLLVASTCPAQSLQAGLLLCSALRHHSKQREDAKYSCCACLQQTQQA